MSFFTRLGKNMKVIIKRRNFILNRRKLKAFKINIRHKNIKLFEELLMEKQLISKLAVFKKDMDIKIMKFFRKQLRMYILRSNIREINIDIIWTKKSTSAAAHVNPLTIDLSMEINTLKLARYPPPKILNRIEYIIFHESTHIIQKLVGDLKSSSEDICNTPSIVNSLKKQHFINTGKFNSILYIQGKLYNEFMRSIKWEGEAELRANLETKKLSQRTIYKLLRKYIEVFEDIKSELNILYKYNAEFIELVDRYVALHNKHANMSRKSESMTFDYWNNETSKVRRAKIQEMEQIEVDLRNIVVKLEKVMKYELVESNQLKYNLGLLISLLFYQMGFITRSINAHSYLKKFISLSDSKIEELINRIPHDADIRNMFTMEIIGIRNQMKIIIKQMLHIDKDLGKVKYELKREDVLEMR
jgi:hypothetical protein